MLEDLTSRASAKPAGHEGCSGCSGSGCSGNGSGSAAASPSNLSPGQAYLSVNQGPWMLGWPKA